MNTPEIPLDPEFRHRAKTNDVPVARLIGFEAKDIADGRQRLSWQRDHNWVRFTAAFFATLPMPQWTWRLQALSHLTNPSPPSN